MESQQWDFANSVKLNSQNNYTKKIFSTGRKYNIAVFARFAVDSRKYECTKTSSCMKEFSAGRAHLQQGAHTRPIPGSVFSFSTYKTNILNLVLDLTTEEKRMLLHICKCSAVCPKSSKSESSDAGYAVRNPISGNREKLSVSGLSPAAVGLAPCDDDGNGDDDDNVLVMGYPPSNWRRLQDDWILYALGGTLNPMGEAPT